MPSHEALQRFVNLIDELRSSAVRLTGHQFPVFGRVALRQPDVGRSPELAFVQLVSWMYVHYVEAGQPGLNFLRRQAESFASGTASPWRHIETVKHLRTSLQHNLELSKTRHIEIERHCGEWYSSACGYVQPRTDHEWHMCTHQILVDAAGLLEASLSTVRQIEGSEFRDTILTQWRRELNRHHDAAEFDSIVGVACTDLGHEAMDVGAFRNRHLAAWRRRIEQLDDGFDFEFEARRLVEDALLSEWPRLLPITGTDIIKELGIPAGREVGRALEIARGLFQGGTVDYANLLEKVREELDLSRGS